MIFYLLFFVLIMDIIVSFLIAGKVYKKLIENGYRRYVMLLSIITGIFSFSIILFVLGMLIFSNVRFER